VFLYSQKLIQETIDCFKEEDNLDISPETANEYLDSLGGFFLAFADKGITANPERVAGIPCVYSSLEENSAFPKSETGLRVLAPLD
jgi:hypothetical protein